MRRSCVMCVLMTGLVLCGCSSGKEQTGPEELALAIRGEYCAASGCTAEVELTSDYGQRVYTYTVKAVVAGDVCTLTVMEPAEIAGITARMSGQEGRLEYDGVVLETGPLTGDGLTPLGAVFALLESARSGFIDSCCLERLGERTVLRILCRRPELPEGQGRQSELWFDAESHRLLRGEIRVDGVRTIRCEWKEFQLI